MNGDKIIKTLLLIAIPLAHGAGWLWGWLMTIEKGFAEMTAWLGIGLVPIMVVIFIACLVISIAFKKARTQAALFALSILAFASGVFLPVWLYGIPKTPI